MLLTSVLTKEKDRRHAEKTLKTGRDRRDAPTEKGGGRVPTAPEAREGRGLDPPSEHPGRTACRRLAFRLLASRTGIN